MIKKIAIAVIAAFMLQSCSSLQEQDAVNSVKKAEENRAHCIEVGGYPLKSMGYIRQAGGPHFVVPTYACYMDKGDYCGDCPESDDKSCKAVCGIASGSGTVGTGEIAQ